MNLMDLSAANCGLAAIAIVKRPRRRSAGRGAGACGVAAATIRVRLLLDGAAALLTAAKGLEARSSKG